MTALYAAAVDQRLAGATVQDYFQEREQSWKEPVDRELYGQLNEFGDAEIAALIAPRPLTVVTRWGGPVGFASEQAEVVRARRSYGTLKAQDELTVKEEASGAEEASAVAVASMLGATQRGASHEISFRVPAAPKYSKPATNISRPSIVMPNVSAQRATACERTTGSWRPRRSQSVRKGPRSYAKNWRSWSGSFPMKGSPFIHAPG